MPWAAGALVSVGGIIAFFPDWFRGGPVAWMFLDAVELPGQPFGGFFPLQLCRSLLQSGLATRFRARRGPV